MTRLSKNFAILTLGNLLSPLFSMVLVLAITRLRGVEVLGKYSLMMTVFVLGQSCATLGLSVVITREVAQTRRDAGRYFVSACAVTLTLVSAAVAAAVAMLQWEVADIELRWAIDLVLVSLLPSVVTLYGEAVLLAFERAGDFVAVNLAENVVRAGVGAILVVLGFGIVSIAVAILTLRIVTSGTYVLALRRRGVVLPMRIDRPLCRDLLRHAPVLGAIPVVNAFYARADILLLTWLGTWTEVGLYSAALRLVDVTRAVPPAYARALYPVLSRLRAGSPQEFADVARDAVRNVLLLFVPVALLLSSLARPVILLLYGPGLAAAADSLRLLAWTLIPLALAATLAQLLFVTNKQAIDLRVNLIATAVSIASAALLIPLWGAVGASIAMLVSMTLYAGLEYVWVSQHVLKPGALEHLARITPAALVSAVLLMALSDMNPLFAGAFGLAVYALGLGVTGAVTARDLKRLRLSMSSAAVGLGGTR